MISILLYFFFFGGLFVLDKTPNRSSRKVFVLLLYVFLSFGYMTGTDWRAYEIDFNDIGNLVQENNYDKGFWLVFYFLSFVTNDFFIALAILKCVYLFSLLYAVKHISNHWMAAMGVMFASIIFMTINNPLRYMVANIFICFAIPAAYERNIKKFLLISFWAVFFHATSIIPILFLLIGQISIPVEKLNKHILFITYILFSIVCSNDTLVSTVFENAQVLLVFLGDNRSYESYSVEGNESFFTIGSFLKMFFAAIIIYNREIVLKNKNGSVIYLYSILYLLLGRIVLLIPTGFRMVIPLSIFYSVAFAIIIMESRVMIKNLFLLLLLSVSLFRTLDSTYAYIPYSNSIYYIITKHKPYPERDKYNIEYYKQRKGTLPAQ